MTPQDVDTPLLAAIEGGGTTFVLSIATIITDDNKTVLSSSISSSDTAVKLTPSTSIKILHTTTIPSDVDPQSTLSQCVDWLRSHRPSSKNGDKLSYGAVGIACFGPLGVNPSDVSSYGRILPSTPKKQWRNVDILSPLLYACTGDNDSNNNASAPPYKLDTDVNAPALAEYETWRSTMDGGKNITSLAYVTVGTGVGVGLIVNSLPVHGMMHPESGHICISPLPNDTFDGYSWGKQRCPYRGKHTVEGTASSVALGERLGLRERRDLASVVEDDDDVWDHAANALASLCVSLILMVSVEGIVIGGGVMKRTCLYGKIRQRVDEILNGYISLPDGAKGLVREATWGDMTGLVGAVVLAKKALDDREEATTIQIKKETRNFSHGFWYGAGLGLVMTFGYAFMTAKKRH